MIEPLDDDGLSHTARTTLAAEVVDRVAERWAEGRALILNANKPDYSEAFTISAAQYAAVREAVLTGIDAHGDDDGVVRLQTVVELVQAQLGEHELFPKGRMTNDTRYVKTDLEARGEVERLAGSGAQRIRRTDG